MILKHRKVFSLINIFLFLFIPLTSFSLDLGASLSLSSSGIETQKVFSAGSAGSVEKISVSFSEPFTGQAGQYTAINVEGCSATEKYGYHLPVKVMTLDLPAGAYLASVKITGGQWQEISGEFNLPPASASIRRNDTSSLPSPLAGEGQGEGDSFLPGTFVEAGEAGMAGGTIVNVSIYPIQYNPATGKALFLKQADVEVSYGYEVQPVPQVLIPMSLGEGEYSAQVDSSAECIIITPQKYYNYAVQLKDIHERQGLDGRLGARVNTTIVTVEEIAGLGYGGTGQPPLASLPDNLCPEGGFASRTGTTYPYRGMLARSYNDRLAQKIISFLLDCRDAPGYKQDSAPYGYYSFMQYLQHIVILGNAAEVPPSYYAYSTVPGVGESYENYVPTDYFYSAVSRQGLNNLNPYAGIGRFPVARSEAEADEALTGLIVATATATARRITVSMDSDPDSLADMTVVVRSGEAANRWLDIESSSWSGGVLTITFRQSRNAGEAWMSAPNLNISAGNIIDIIDTRPQMAAMINKIGAWVNARTGNNDWFKNVSFAGGTYKHAFGKTPGKTASVGSASLSSIFWDELSCVEAINKVDEVSEGGDGLSYVAGLGVRKYFASNIKPDDSTYDDAFIEAHIEPILQNSVTPGILYFAGDGWKDEVYLEGGDVVSSSDLLGYAVPSTENTFIVSHAGSTASFDEEITESAAGQAVSFGNASLLSPAGSFAYFGPTRSPARTISWSRAADGLLIHSQTESNELTMNVLRRYHRAKAGTPTLSEVVTKALGDYYTKNLASGSSIRHFRTLIEYNLLGSTAIYIPAPGAYSAGYEYTGVPEAEPLAPHRVNSDNVPVYEVADGGTVQVTVEYSSAASDNEVTLVDPRYYTCDDVKTGTGSSEAYTFDAVDAEKSEVDGSNGPGLYFVRVSQRENLKTWYTKESRYYFEVVNRFTPAGDILLIDDDQPRRYTANNNNPDGTEVAWQSMYPDFDDPLPQSSQYPFVGGDYYREALDALGYAEGVDYKVWHVENKDGTNAAGQGRHGEWVFTEDMLNQYIGANKAVIWYTGNDWFTTILAKERTALQNFLDEGGKLFITGQDIGYDVRGTSFYTNYLKAGYVQDNISLLGVDGIVDDELSDGLGNITISGTGAEGGAYNQEYPSEIDPQSGAMPCLFYHPTGTGGGARQSSGSAGIRYYNEDTGAAVVYFAFGFEAINNFSDEATGRKSVMNKVLTWLVGEKQPTTGNLTATGLDTQVLLEWSNPFDPPASGVLIVYREADGYPTGEPVNGTQYNVGGAFGDDGTVIYSQIPVDNEYLHEGLTNGTTYYYKAYAFTGTYVYTYLDMASATPEEGYVPPQPGELPAPTNLTATAVEELGTWKIELAWTDNSSDEDGFEISRKAGADGVWNDAYAAVGAGVQSYTDDEGGAGLAEGTIYYYRVRAFRDDAPDPVVKSDWSNEASAATSYIGPPSNLRAVGGEREAWLYWEGDFTGATGFEIQRKHPTPLTPNPAWVSIADISVASTTYLDELKTSPNIPDGRPYYYRVRAYNTVMKTEWSNEAWTNPIPSAFPAGEDPTNLEVFPGWNTLVVQFDDNTDNESSYLVELWTTPPSNTGTPSRTVYVPPLSGSAVNDSPIIINFAEGEGGKYYVRVIAFHKTTDYGFSRYAPAAGGGGYISFDLPSQGSSSGSMGSCFIATAAFGSPSERHVKTLRDFRDRFLMCRRQGRAFVRWYYRHSPPLADYIRRRPAVRAFVRGVLRPLAYVVSRW